MRFISLLLIIFIVLFFGCKSADENIVVNVETDNTNDSNIEVSKMGLTITSSAFKNNGIIPAKYTCKGEDVNPPLIISGVPVRAKALTLIVEDPDAPVGNWVHWMIYNFDPLTTEIKENSLPLRGVLGRNDFGKIAWGGPCPPSGTHRYFFRLYALDTNILLGRGATKDELLAAMDGHVIEKAELVGLFSR